MKLFNSLVLERIFISLVIVVLCTFSSYAQDDRHEMENLHVTIPATEYKSSRFIEKVVIKGKDYITGKSSSYKKSGEANAGILLQPHAEYVISSKLPGGSYHILVYYTLDKENTPDNPKISISMNTQKAQEVELTSKQLKKYAKATFKVNFLKGKNHTVKIWLPSQGVRVSEIKVMRALFSSKDKKSVKE